VLLGAVDAPKLGRWLTVAALGYELAMYLPHFKWQLELSGAAFASYVKLLWLTGIAVLLAWERWGKPRSTRRVGSVG
jgi:hypothetical protein